MNQNQMPNPMQPARLDDTSRSGGMPVAPTPVPQAPITPPKPPMPTPAKTSGSGAKALYWILALVVVIAAVYFLLNRSGGLVPAQQPQAKFTNENVKVSNVDVSNATGAAKLPVGFPTGTPVELANITNSSTITYPDKQAVLYSVMYMSAKQPEEIYANYAAYLKKANYALGPTVKTPNQLTYLAIGSAGRMYIVITPQGGGATVQVSYTVRTTS